MGFFEKLGEGLRKTRDSIFGSIAGLVNAGEITDELYDDLEEQLILADTGADVAMRLVEELRQEVRRKHLKTGADALEALKGIIRCWSSASTAWEKRPPSQSWLICTSSRASA